MSALFQRLAWCVTALGLIVGLVIADTTRFGPATPLSRCNLALTTSTNDPANVLVLGSSRTGAAIDPVAMQDLLRAEHGLTTTAVERIALGRSPLRANVALLENYLAERGEPEVIIFEISFLTERSVDRIDAIGSGLAADAYLFRRDLNLLRYGQILDMPAVAMPYTESESALNRLRYRLRGTTLRTGALAYQTVRAPTADASLDACDTETWNREATWPSDFTFSWDEARATGRADERIGSLLVDAATTRATTTADMTTADTTTDTGAAAQRYPYDFDQPYRAGELALLDRAVDLAASHHVPLVLLPLTTRGSELADEDAAFLDDRYGSDARIYDLYADAQAVTEHATFWYDDAHLEAELAGELTTALLVAHLLDGPFAPHERNRPIDASSEPSPGQLAARSGE